MLSQVNYFNFTARSSYPSTAAATRF